MNQENFDALWCFIWGRTELSDNESKDLAHRLMLAGINTWEQWINAGELPRGESINNSPHKV